MSKPTREWFQLKDSVVLMDFSLRTPLAYIRRTMRKDEYPCWTPNQEENLYEIEANVGRECRIFKYNPHNQEELALIIDRAMTWCEDMLGPPVKSVNIFQFVKSLLMFWKYEPIWHRGFIVGLRPKDKRFKQVIEEQQRVRDEWKESKNEEEIQ